MDRMILPCLSFIEDHCRIENLYDLIFASAAHMHIYYIRRIITLISLYLCTPTSVSSFLTSHRHKISHFTTLVSEFPKVSLHYFGASELTCCPQFSRTDMPFLGRLSHRRDDLVTGQHPSGTVRLAYLPFLALPRALVNITFSTKRSSDMLACGY